MSIQEVVSEQLAELIHHYQSALGGDPNRFANADLWDQVPQEERSRLIAAARLALLELAATEKQEIPKRYFAKPGQAEWGC